MTAGNAASTIGELKVNQSLEWLRHSGTQGAKSSTVQICPDAADLLHQPYTDLGNAERMVQLYGGVLRFCHPWGTWLVWDGRRWALDATAKVMRIAKATTRRMFRDAALITDPDRRDGLLKLARSTEKLGRLNAMITLAACEDGIPVLPDELDANPWLLNVQNGTLNLRTGALLKHDPTDAITKLARVCYDKAAECPQWLAFQNRVMNDDAELIAFKQRAYGYALTGLATEKRSLFIYSGSGNNGKSTEVEVVRDMLGEYAGQLRIESLMEQRHRDSSAASPDIADLRGLRFVASSEPKEGARLESSVVKYLTSMGRVKARQLHKGNFEFDQTWKIFLDCNAKPVITETTNAIWNRIGLVPFNVEIRGEEIDADLPRKLRTELPGILAWAVRGCLDWQEQGLKVPSAVDTATEDYRLEQDVFGQFLKDKTQRGPVLSVMGSRLYAEYEKWCKQLDGDLEQKPISIVLFSERLKNRGLAKVKTNQGVRWDGIRLLVDP